MTRKHDSIVKAFLFVEGKKLVFGSFSCWLSASVIKIISAVKQSLFVIALFWFRLPKNGGNVERTAEQTSRWSPVDTAKSGPKYFSHFSCSWGATDSTVFRSSLQPRAPCRDHGTQSLARIPRSKGFVEQFARGKICLAIILQLQRKRPGLLQHRYL